MDIKYKIKPRQTSNGFSTASYYQAIIRDIMDIDMSTDWTGWKRLSQNQNQNVLNKIILAKSSMQVMRKKLYVLLNFMKVLYGQNSDDFRVIMRLYIGLKKQMAFVLASKRVLTYAVIPKHYLKAVLYEADQIETRMKKLEDMIEEYIKITPLAAYRSLLPEGKTLEDDIWERIDMDDNANMEEQVSLYIADISRIVDINGRNEDRERCLATRKRVAEKIAEDKAEEREKTRKKDRDLADQIASNIAGNLYAKRFSSKVAEWETLYTKAADFGYEKPKLIVVISTYRISGRAKRRPKYFMDDMTLTTALSHSTIFDDAKPLPQEIRDMYDQCRIGYAEIMLT